MPKSSKTESDRMQELCRYIEAQGEEALSLADLAVRCGMSSFHLQRRFKAVIGVSPKEYRDSLRLRRLKETLRTGASVTAAVYDAGFNSSSRVYGAADRRLGMTPRQYRQKGKETAISYAEAKTPLGRLMVAATDRGICFIQFGADKDELYNMLEQEFPEAALAPMAKASAGLFTGWMEELSAYLHGETARLDLPLDIRGTAFQLKVWKYLQGIPAGTTQSYAEVARGIGKPAAARAVARACALNNVALAIPCHRVIRGTGELSGYRWGIDRKRRLLALEKESLGGKPSTGKKGLRAT